ncbi:Transcriptional regulator, AraC family [Fulvivirga imtechensis AK7]|uniref:Transcriptional regulator, AraC family n=1 Tax=Fulvivirga imtechensis AK7 TaxID=1237149 RepID=L8JZ47_9BACT|nr:helix-turn-helix domain-containing protein [Fulvivirga imtechensis]ELR72467.1 Transcriptional regulator, AraC family [Fulvivirga imtechensis AK7]
MKDTIYQRIDPAPGLTEFIDCYWIIENLQQEEVREQKIIPDGYTELIFHYSDAYEIKLESDWQTQPYSLVAGQIRKHFFLRNTRHVGMVGVKLKPTALAELFGLKMNQLADKVVDAQKLIPGVDKLALRLRSATDNQKRIVMVEDYFKEVHSRGAIQNKVRMAIEMMRKGSRQIKEITEAIGLSERQLERLFSHYVGLSPKFYARILQFNTIFELMQKGDPSWSDIVFESGYFDQSHFIKSFRQFTGEDPSKYIFDQPDMANFFLRRC